MDKPTNEQKKVCAQSMCLDDPNSNELRCLFKNCIELYIDIRDKFNRIVAECGENETDYLCQMIYACDEKPGKNNMAQCLHMSYLDDVTYQKD